MNGTYLSKLESDTKLLSRYFRLTGTMYFDQFKIVDILWVDSYTERVKEYQEGAPCRMVGCFSYAGISSTADVQGRALCPGSTPGAPFLLK